MIRKLKTHYRPLAEYYVGCMRHDGPRTDDVNEVTCVPCLKRIRSWNLRNRSEFPDFPTFQTYWDSMGFATFRCPRCGKKNSHGNGNRCREGFGENGGWGDCIRGSHCDCWRSYELRLPKRSATSSKRRRPTRPRKRI